MEIYGFGRARESTRGIKREIEKIDDRVPRNEGLSSIFFWRSVGRRWISRSCFYEQIEVGKIVKLFFPDGQKGCGRDGIV